ncbi:hypothetical protein NYR55_03140 [Sphingomonas sp. BGYR3]|uniref:hypothetical protein n=1 Tax=Sphingomonas sp. BGYR3 TaxID=2975483 RepID=UPI0021A78CCC|nr:hypothetical protein [Sphingomonas sp. BGYR3]MDG5487620.1 hypothetical protein [Sphingomonas sp. BGYR3]
MRIHPLLIALILPLAACDGGTPAADNGVDPAANEATPAPPAAAALSPQIPDAFQGMWDSDARACAQDVSEMRLTVAADGLRFYESVAKVDAVGRPDPRRIEVDAAVEAEGMTQGRHFTLELRGDDRLATTIDGATAVRVRCDDGGPK